MSWAIPQDWQAAYNEAMQAALVDNETFANFRRLKGYNYIMADSMPQDMATALYNSIAEHPHLLEVLERVKVTDTIGNPKVRQPFNTSPRNLRYIYTAHLIEQRFPTIKNVVEIGVGYGGLCYVLHELFDIEHYIMLDLDPALKLARKFLSCFPKTNNIKGGTPPYDITISECALTELDFIDVLEYHNHYISKSKGFLIRSNYHTQQDFDRLMDLLKRDFEVEISPLWPNGSTEKICGRILIGTLK